MSRQAKSLLMGMIFGLAVGLWGGYGMRETPLRAREQLPRAAIEVVNRATDLLNEYGHEAFAAFDQDSRYNRADTYLFVLAADGTTLYHAADAAQVGENFGVLRDIDQRPFGLQLVSDAAPDGVWSAYRWNNPATGKAEWKLTYTRQTRQGHIVAAGIFGGLEK